MIRSTNYHFPFLFILLILAACGTTQSQSTAPPAVAPERFPLYVTTDNGFHWEGIQSNLPAETQVSFMQEMDGRFLIASDNNGLWLSDKTLGSWQQIGQGLPGPKLNALQIIGDEILVSVYRAGIFSSSDLGNSWRSLNEDLPELRVQALLKLADETILAGTDKGIYRRDPSSVNWEAVLEGPQILSFQLFDDRILAGTSVGALLLDAEGKNAEWIHQNGAIHYSEIINGIIVLLYVHGDVMLSYDQGESWTKADYSPQKNSYAYDITSVGSEMILSNNYGIHHSLDQGRSWRLIYPMEDMAFFEFLTVGDRAYGGTRRWDEYRGRE